MIETFAQMEKMAADSMIKMKNSDGNLKTYRSKTKVRFGLENLTAVNFSRFRRNCFFGQK